MATSSSSEDSSLPVLRLTYKQLLEKKSHRLRKYKEQSKSCQYSPESPRQDKHALPGGGSPYKKATDSSTTGTSWESIWTRWKSHEKKLDKLCLRWAGSSDHLEHVLSICHEMESASVELVKDHSYKDDITSKLWRSCHYKIIEKLRKFYKQSQTSVVKTSLGADLQSFLSSSVQFYSSLITLCETVSHFDVNNFSQVLHNDHVSSSKSHKVKLAVNSIHHCYLSLGDLSRYSEELKESPDWSKARSYYLKSKDLVPKDGKPYNQLAVIAINSHRRLDAVYYYCRSLWTKNSFLSAHDSLMALFDETSRKIKDTFDKKESISPSKNQKGHQEVWLMPGHDNNKTVPVNDENTSLDTPELSKKVSNLFLFLHSKLFTKVGIEQFSVVLTEFLSSLTTYLTRESSSSSFLREGPKLVKMVAISISTIHHIIQNTSDPHSQIISLSLSLSLGLQFITNLLKLASSSLTAQILPSSDVSDVLSIYEDLLSNLAVIIPPIRVWFSWLSTHVTVWKPVLNKNNIKIRLFEFLNELCDVINTTQSLLPLRLPAPASSSLSYSKYWEDRELAGFSCLTSLTNSSYEDTLVTPDIGQLNKEEVCFQCLSRLSLLQYEIISHTSFQHFLNYDSSNNKLTVLLDPDLPLSPPSLENLTLENKEEIEREEEEEEEEKEEFANGGESYHDLDTIHEEGSDIVQLKKEKERLAQQLHEHQEHKLTTQSLLKEARKGDQSSVTIKPKYLIPDTNCFLDHMTSITFLSDTGHFILSVPLIVIVELEGLSKDTCPVKSQNSLHALAYIKEQISAGSTRIKPLTSHGNLLSSLLTTSETSTDQACNDDVILESCIKLHERVDSAHMSNDSALKTVVLLTDDRNLRVKSHASQVPVQSINQFIKMLKQ